MMNADTPLPLHSIFARFVAQTEGVAEDAPIVEIVNRLMAAIAMGHSCLYLTDDELLQCRKLEKVITHDPAPGAPIPSTLLVCRDHRLYLQRYDVYEQRIAQALRALMNEKNEENGTAPFPLNLPPYEDEIDGQKLAVFMAINQRFTLITGGPGTGKTTGVLKIIQRLLQLNPNERIIMCAPTGKAQARMKESLDEELRKETQLPDDLRAKIQAVPRTTLHRMLHPIFANSAPMDSHKHLPYDTLIVDECSMISTALMAYFLTAISPHARVIFLGDKDQLPSVEAGSILADMCANCPMNTLPAHLQAQLQTEAHWTLPIADSSEHPLAGHAVALLKNYRFKDDNPIGIFAQKIRSINTPQDIKNIAEKFNRYKRDTHTPIPSFGVYSPAQASSAFKELVFQKNIKIDDCFYAFADLKSLAQKPTRENLKTAFKIIEEFKVLCAETRTKLGTISINRYLRQLLGFSPGIQAGIPIIVRENNESLQLYNGDVGLIWPAKDDSPENLQAFFRNPNPSQGGNNDDEFHPYPLAQLPQWEEVFAMTIHKSQGSGFQTVITLFPEHEMPLLTRELLYTAITRAKQNFYLIATDARLHNALKKRTQRQSGLMEALRQPPIKGA